MSESKKLTKRQSAVIDDLFAGELEEQAILKKHHVRRYEYERWLADGRFAAQLELRIVHGHRQGRITLARYAATAAVKLVELAASGKGETARKACLDIIAPLAPADQNSRADGGSDETPVVPSPGGLTPELAGRLLAALAQERQSQETDGSRS